MRAQSMRPMVIETPLGKDELLLCGFSGNESHSSLFGYQLDMRSENPAIAFIDIVGQEVSI